MRGTDDLRTQLLEDVRRASQWVLCQPADKLHNSRLVDAMVAFWGILARFPGGEAFLIAHAADEYTRRHTRRGTPYAEVWERSHKYAPPEWGKLNRPYPDLKSAPDLEEISERIQRLLDRDTEARKDHLSEPEDEPLAGILTNEARTALRAWQQAANELLFDVQGWPRPGCDLLLEIHRDGEDSLAANAIWEFAEEIKKAVRFLVKELAGAPGLHGPMLEPEGTRSSRPCYERDHMFLKWYEAEGAETYHSHAAIAAKWNGMGENERKGICPYNPGKVNRQVVIAAVKKAKKEKTPA